jgi:hypothetical protein
MFDLYMEKSLSNKLSAISIKQPWADSIIFGNKRVENRSWNTKHRGRILIHASLQEDKKGNEFIKHKNIPGGRLKGFIIGEADIVDVIHVDSNEDRTKYSSREKDVLEWFFGPYGFVLDNIVVYKNPVKYKGNLGIFKVDSDLIKDAI